MKKSQSEVVANRFAKSLGYGRATSVVVSSDYNTPTLIRRVDYGHRKCSTGQYVPTAYLNNFGWKNTYYQHAVTEIGLPVNYDQARS
jgi:hypothetical protein